jgi:hypothetical protein
MKILNAILPEYSNITGDGKYAYTYNASKNNISLNDAIETYIENLQNLFAFFSERQ